MTYIPPHLKSDKEKEELFFGKRNSKIINGTYKKPSKPLIRESDIHTQVCKYIKAQYPKVMFLSDFGAGIKMTKGMAQRQVMQKSGHAFPDLMIFEPVRNWHGLFIELKRDYDSLYNKDGSFKKSGHISEQYTCLNELRKKGYYADFACGFDAAKEMIDSYLLGF